MDTAQRGIGLDWETAKQLITLSLAEARAVNGRIVCGAQTDQLTTAQNLRDVEAAYEEQCELIESQDGRVVLMASRELAKIAHGPDDYIRVYGRLLSQLRKPAIIHWLGEMFDPAVAGYWAHEDLDQAEQVRFATFSAHPVTVRGVTITLLHRKRSGRMRERL